MLHEHVHFLEAAFVQQHGYAFAGCIFAFIVLLGYRFFATAQAGCRAAVNEFFDFFQLVTHFLFCF